MQLIVEKAVQSDAQDIFNLINLAYKVEFGNSGVAFKKTNRYLSLEEIDIDGYFVIRNGNSLMACMYVSKVDSETVELGPIAVHPESQVCKTTCGIFASFSKNYLNLNISG